MTNHIDEYGPLKKMAIKQLDATFTLIRANRKEK